ncbi:hypothetical protein SLS60_006149 [Paraconiothyrium brasiliense]|uniref:Uncharacterized protein n=1 Tax=Paraconiothyrium brasiliense TaxID=300254 RepID=A0ABR3REV1_9PLEO
MSLSFASSFSSFGLLLISSVSSNSVSRSLSTRSTGDHDSGTTDTRFAARLVLRSSMRDVARLLLRSNWLFSDGLDGDDDNIDPRREMDSRSREVRFRLSPPLPATIVVVTTFIGNSRWSGSRFSSWSALVRKSDGAVFLLDTGLGFFSVPGGEVLDVFDEFRDLFLGSAGECMKVSVVGVKRAVGTGGGEAGIGGSGSVAGFDLCEGAADDAFDGSRDNGALGLDVRELGVELVLHLSFHLLSVFLIPVPSVEQPLLEDGDGTRWSCRSRDGTEVNSTWEGQRNGTHPLITATRPKHSGPAALD